MTASARRLVGDRSQTWTWILVALWPFGFHFGRVAAWYSFCFLLVSLLTWTYLRYLERSTLTNWLWLLVSALLLVYSNYFRWAVLGLVALDLAAPDPRAFVRQWKRPVGGALLLTLAYSPILAAFFGEVHDHVRPPHSFLATMFTGIYNLYCIFVSESVAPRIWALGVPAGMFIITVFALTLRYGPWPARRFLAVMTLLGIVGTKRLLLIAPWLILAIGVTLGALPATCWAWRVCVSLAAIAGIGWYGVFPGKKHLTASLG